MENRSSLWLYVGLIIFFVTQVTLGELIELHPPKDRFLIPPPSSMDKFTFGFSESLADSFWLRWIQDADNCQTYLAPVVNLPAMPLSELKQSPLADPRHRICDQSWSFTMLDVVTKLAPKFKMPYLAGGISLAVLTEDYVGASVIFDRGVATYPGDWNLTYRASYHYMIDMHDRAKAADLLDQSVKHGAPSWMQALASRLYTESGEIELALRTLLAYQKTMVGEAGRKDIGDRIAALRKRLQNSKSEN